MPLLILLILAIMIAQIGFWDTLSAIVGGVLMIALLVLLVVAALVLVGFLAVRRTRGG